jgi:hypothetical protein
MGAPRIRHSIIRDSRARTGVLHPAGGGICTGKADAGVAEMNRTSLSPAMMIFNWRGDHATDRRPELQSSSPPSPAAAVAEDEAPPPPIIEVEFGGVAVRTGPGIDPRVFTEILHAVWNSAADARAAGAGR